MYLIYEYEVEPQIYPNAEYLMYWRSQKTLNFQKIKISSIKTNMQKFIIKFKLWL